MIKARSSSHDEETINHPAHARTAYAILMMIGVPIMLVLSGIAASPSLAIQLTYGQGPTTGEQRQETKSLNFQTTNVTL